MKKKTKITSISIAVICILSIGFFTLGADIYKGNENVTQEENETEKSENENVEPILTKDGSSYGEKDFSSNANLYQAHIISASLVNKTSFDNGGEPLDKDYELNNIKKILDDIQTGNEESHDEIKKIKSLVNEALEMEAAKKEPILDDINDEIKELDEYYNGDTAHSEVEVDDTGTPVNEEDHK